MNISALCSKSSSTVLQQNLSSQVILSLRERQDSGVVHVKVNGLKCAWLHYIEENDAVICYICADQNRQGKYSTIKNKESAFTEDGFSNRKKAIKCFHEHQKSVSYFSYRAPHWYHSITWKRN